MGKKRPQPEGTCGVTEVAGLGDAVMSVTLMRPWGEALQRGLWALLLFLFVVIEKPN